ncbi:MAG: carboxypeptidase-like regulatory domain-containing protein, partial [Candidatus Cryptobacteroides sp.]
MKAGNLLLKVLSFLLGILSVQTLSYSATPGKYDVKLSFRNAKVEKVLDEITRQTGITFSYETTLGEQILQSVEVSASDSELEPILRKIFAGRNITWAIHGKVVALTLVKPRSEPAQPEDQTKFTVNGTVTEKGGIPLVGVTVMVDGLSVGTQTDPDGKWELNLPDGYSDVVFSCMGFKTVTHHFSAPGRFDLEMSDDSKMLDEVVVIGYGTQKKANLTGSVSSIDFAKTAEGRPVLSTSSALAGLAPGMSVLQGSGQPGSEAATIRIRGVGSFTSASCSPL